MLRKIMIIGSGIVGQASGKGLLRKGYDVTFVDNNKAIVEKLKQEGFVAYLPNELEEDDNNSNGGSSSNVDAEISMVSVPTPSNQHDGSADLSYITSAIIQLGRWLKNKRKKSTADGNSSSSSSSNSNYHLVVIRSTVPIGTCRNVLIPLLQTASGLGVGSDFGLCMQPEFMRTLSGEYDFLNPHVTVIGQFDKRSGDELEKIYSNFRAPLFRVGLEQAEFMKYVHNCFNATKISFANEMWLLGQRLEIDANLALQLAVMSAEGFWNPNYGTIGGLPYGGPCLPKDVKSFLAFAREFGISMPLISAADSVNSEMEKLAEKGQVPYATLSQPKRPQVPPLTLPLSTTNNTTTMSSAQSLTTKRNKGRKNKKKNNNSNNNKKKKNRLRHEEYILTNNVQRNVT
jgi:UDPglucose 6-dehydrogenase